MIEKYLKAKHWQLFILLYGIPMLLQFILMGMAMSRIFDGDELKPEFMFDFFKYFPLIMVLYMAVFFGWYWSVAIGLDKLIPDNLKLKTGRFKVLLFIPIIYLLIISILMGNFMPGAIIGGESAFLKLFVIIVPIHLLSMFCIFYCLYFVAKTIKTAEFQKEVSFGDFAGEFFLIWFFPIGVWFVQPRINKLLAQSKI